MSLVVQPRRRHRHSPVDGAVTLLHLSDDDLRTIFGLVDMPFALKLTCAALRTVHPDTTKTSVKHVVKAVGLMVWAHECGLFRWLETDQIAKQAARTWPGGDEALEFLTKPVLYHHDVEYRLDFYMLCLHAASTGLIPMLEWLNYEGWRPSATPVREAEIWRAAASNGHLACLQWLCAQNDMWHERNRLERRRPLDVEVEGENLLAIAARKGNLEMARWLLEKGARVGDDAVKIAAAGGHVPMLVDLLRKGFTWSLRTWHALYFHVRRTAPFKPIPLDTLQFVVTTGLSWHRRQAWINAVETGHVEAVEWLLGHEPDVAPYWGNDDGFEEPDHYIVGASACGGLETAATRGHTRMLACAHRNGAELTEELCEGAARGESLETIKWLHEHNAPTSRHAVEDAARCGNMEMLVFMHAHGYVLGSEVYTGAVWGSKLEVLEWASAPPVSCALPTEHADKCHIMDEAVRAADTAVLQWLLDHNAGCLRRPHTFQAVRKGQVVLLEWLLRNGCPYDASVLNVAAQDFAPCTKERVAEIIRGVSNDEFLDALP